MQSNTDWDTVTVLRKKPAATASTKSPSVVNQALRAGAEVDTSKKYNAGQNRQHSAVKDTARLDEETEEFRHEHVSLDVARTIQQARNEKKWTQKELAQRLNEPATVIAEYENGKAIPSQQILGKMERVLGVHLRGKHMGEKFEVGGKKGASSSSSSSSSGASSSKK